MPRQRRYQNLELNLVESLAVDAQSVKVSTSWLAMCTNGSGNGKSCAENGKGFADEVTGCLGNVTHVRFSFVLLRI